MVNTLRNFILFRFAILVTLFGAFWGCKKVDTSKYSDIPAYIKINDISVKSDQQLFGANTDQITDAWVFVDDEQIGVFQLPCEIPVLLVGDRNIKVFGGIKRGGINSQRAMYEFYDEYSIDTTLVAEETIELNPVVSYKPSTVVNWKENFEDISLLVDSIPSSTVPIKRLNDPSIVQSGLYCGAMLLTTESSSATAYTVDKISINKFVPSYIELDYKTNVELKISMRTTTVVGVEIPADIITVRPSDDAENNGWKKMYVFIAPGVGANPDAQTFQFYFNAELPIGQTSGYVYLDNIKVIQ